MLPTDHRADSTYCTYALSVALSRTVASSGRYAAAATSIRFESGRGGASAVKESDTPTMTLETRPGTVLGTINYMAPEQVRGRQTDARSDIFSFGCILYEMVTGRRSFVRDTGVETMTAILRENPPDIADSDTLAPPEFSRVIMRCLEKKAADRWQHAEELLPHLDAILTPSGGMTPTGTQPVMAMTTSAAERAVRNAQPLRVMGLFGLASVGALAIV